MPHADNEHAWKQTKQYLRAGKSMYIVKVIGQKSSVLWPGGAKKCFIGTIKVQRSSMGIRRVNSTELKV